MEFEKSKLIELKEKFDSIINTEEKDNIEFWYARDLQIQLGYKRWENFINIFLFQVVVYGILFSVENISTKGKINIGNKVSMTFI